jgi:hypothetical protein
MILKIGGEHRGPDAPPNGGRLYGSGKIVGQERCSIGLLPVNLENGAEESKMFSGM